MPLARINPTDPINWGHPGNDGLIFWMRGIHSQTNGKFVRNLVSGEDAAFGSSNDWNGSCLADGVLGLLGVDGNSQVSFSTAINSLFTTELTVVGIFTPTSLGDYREVASQNNNGGTYPWGLRINPSGTPNWYSSTITGTNCNGSTTLVINKTYHYCGTLGVSGAKCFIDGVEDGSASSSGATIGSSGVNWQLLGDNYGPYAGQGLLECFRAYNRVLPPGEVSWLREEAWAGYPNLLNRISPRKYFQFSSQAVIFTASGGLSIKGQTLAGSATFSPGTHTASGVLSIKGETLAGSATFSPGIHTALGSLSVKGETISATATFGAGTHTASGVLSIKGETLAGTSTFSAGAHTASGALSIKGETLAATVTYAPGTHTASGALTAGPIVVSGSSTFSPGTHIASGSLSVGPETISGSVTFSPGTHTSAGALSIASESLSASSSFSPGTHTAVAALSLGGEVLAGTVTYSAGTHTAGVSLSVAPETLAGLATFSAGVHTAAGALAVGPETLSSSVSYSPGTHTASGSLTIKGETLAATVTLVQHYAIVGALTTAPMILASVVLKIGLMVEVSGVQGVSMSSLLDVSQQGVLDVSLVPIQNA